MNTGLALAIAMPVCFILGVFAGKSFDSGPQGIAETAIESTVGAAADVVSGVLYRNCENDLRESDLLVIETRKNLLTKELEIQRNEANMKIEKAVQQDLRRELDVRKENNQILLSGLDSIQTRNESAACPVGDGARIAAAIDFVRGQSTRGPT